MTFAQAVAVTSLDRLLHRATVINIRGENYRMKSLGRAGTNELAPTAEREAVELIGKLYDVEQRAREMSSEDRLALRRAESRPALDLLHERLSVSKLQLLPKHAMSDAIGYALRQWKEPNVFAGKGAVPIDNNVSEREMKRIVLNRKSSLFVGNQRGGETAANLASLTSTCRRLGTL